MKLWSEGSRKIRAPEELGLVELGKDEEKSGAMSEATEAIPARDVSHRRKFEKKTGQGGVSDEEELGGEKGGGGNKLERMEEVCP